MKEQAHQRIGGGTSERQREIGADIRRRQEMQMRVIGTELRQREAGVRFDCDPGDEDRA